LVHTRSIGYVLVEHKWPVENPFLGSCFLGSREWQEWCLQIPDSREWKNRSGNGFFNG